MTRKDRHTTSRRRKRRFSVPTASRIYYAAKKGNKWYAVIDGKESREYDEIAKDTPIFSSDSKHAAYAAGRGLKCFVVLDGKEGPEYESISKGARYFSPDGKHMAYAAQNKTKWLMVIDGRAGPEFDGLAKDSTIFQSRQQTHSLRSAKGTKVACSH